MSEAAIAAILGMAAVTYLTRISGFWLAGRFQHSSSLFNRMKYVPCAVLAAIVAPAMLKGGLAEWSGFTICLAVMILTRSFLLCLIAAVLVVVLLR